MVNQMLPPVVHERGPAGREGGAGRHQMRPLYIVSALTPALVYYALAQHAAMAPLAMLFLSGAAAPTVFLLLRPFAKRLPHLEDAPRAE